MSFVELLIAALATWEVIEIYHHSHIAEAHQYGCLHYNAQFSQTYAGMRVQRKEIKRKVYTYA